MSKPALVEVVFCFVRRPPGAPPFCIDKVTQARRFAAASDKGGARAIRAIVGQYVGCRFIARLYMRRFIACCLPVPFDAARGAALAGLPPDVDEPGGEMSPSPPQAAGSGPNLPRTSAQHHQQQQPQPTPALPEQALQPESLLPMAMAVLEDPSGSPPLAPSSLAPSQAPPCAPSLAHTAPRWAPSPTPSWSQTGHEQSSVVDAMLEGVRGLLHSDNGATTTFTATASGTPSVSTLLSTPHVLTSPAPSTTTTANTVSGILGEAPGGAVGAGDQHNHPPGGGGGAVPRTLAAAAAAAASISQSSATSVHHYHAGGGGAATGVTCRSTATTGTPTSSVGSPGNRVQATAAVPTGAAAVAASAAAAASRRRPSPVPRSTRRRTSSTSTGSSRLLGAAGVMGSTGSGGSRAVSGISTFRFSGSGGGGGSLPPLTSPPPSTSPPTLTATMSTPPPRPHTATDRNCVRQLRPPAVAAAADANGAADLYGTQQQRMSSCPQSHVIFGAPAAADDPRVELTLAPASAAAAVAGAPGGASAGTVSEPYDGLAAAASQMAPGPSRAAPFAAAAVEAGDTAAASGTDTGSGESRLRAPAPTEVPMTASALGDPSATHRAATSTGTAVTTPDPNGSAAGSDGGHPEGAQGFVAGAAVAAVARRPGRRTPRVLDTPALLPLLPISTTSELADVHSQPPHCRVEALLADVASAVQPLSLAAGSGRSSIITGVWRGLPVAVKIMCSAALAPDGAAVTAVRRAGTAGHRHLVNVYGIRTAQVDQASVWTLVPESRRVSRAFAQTLAPLDRRHAALPAPQPPPPQPGPRAATPATTATNTTNTSVGSTSTAAGSQPQPASTTATASATATASDESSGPGASGAAAAPAAGGGPAPPLDAHVHDRDPSRPPPSLPLVPVQQQQGGAGEAPSAPSNGGEGGPNEAAPPPPVVGDATDASHSATAADSSGRAAPTPGGAAGPRAGRVSSRAAAAGPGRPRQGQTPLALPLPPKLASPLGLPPLQRALLAPGRDTSTSPRRMALAAVRPRPGEHVAVVIMEHCEMGDLATLLCMPFNPFRPNRRWPPYMAARAVLRCAREVAAALAHLHRRGLLHGGIKPTNVLLVPTRGDLRGFSVKLSDASFSGTCLEDGGPAASSSGLLYSSPEALRHGPSRQADVWAFGLLMLAMVLAPQPPFAGEPTVPLLLRIAETSYRPPWPQPCAAGPYAALLQPLYERCTAADPDVRPTFEQVYEELRTLEARVRSDKRCGGGGGGGAAPTCLTFGEPSAAAVASSSAAVAGVAVTAAEFDAPLPLPPAGTVACADSNVGGCRGLEISLAGAVGLEAVGSSGGGGPGGGGGGGGGAAGNRASATTTGSAWSGTGSASEHLGGSSALPLPLQPRPLNTLVTTEETAVVEAEAQAADVDAAADGADAGAGVLPSLMYDAELSE